MGMNRKQAYAMRAGRSGKARYAACTDETERSTDFRRTARLRVHRSGEKIRRGGAGITVGRSYRTYIFGIAPYYRKYTDVFSADGAFVLTFYILYDKIVVLVTNASQLVFN